MSNNPKGVYIEWDNIGLCGLVGMSGSGKTSTIRFLLAQMALSGTGIILIDGHGRMNSQTQTLAQSCESLSGAYIVPAAITDEDIIASIRLARDIAQARVDGKDNSRSHIALVIDEYVSIIDRMDQSTADFVTATMLKFATEYRKTEVKAFIAAHNWTKDFINSAAIRRSMNAVLLHRVSPDTVPLFTRNPIIRRNAPDMRVGEAYIIQAGADPIKVYIPKILVDDLKAVSHRVIPFDEYTKLEEISHVVSRGVSAPQSENSHFLNTDYSHDLLLKWYKEIKKCAQSGMNKADTISTVWGVLPGSSKRYKTASRIYDYLKGKM